MGFDVGAIVVFLAVRIIVLTHPVPSILAIPSIPAVVGNRVHVPELDGSVVGARAQVYLIARQLKSGGTCRCALKTTSLAPYFTSYAPLDGELGMLADDAYQLVGVQLYDADQPIRGPRRKKILWHVHAVLVCHGLVTDVYAGLACMRPENTNSPLSRNYFTLTLGIADISHCSILHHLT